MWNIRMCNDAKRYICKKLLNLDCEDNIRFGIYSSSHFLQNILIETSNICLKNFQIAYLVLWLFFNVIMFPAGIYMFKVNNRNTRKRCEICSKLTIKIQEQRHWCRSGIFIVNFEHISRLALVFVLLTLNK